MSNRIIEEFLIQAWEEIPDLTVGDIIDMRGVLELMREFAEPDEDEAG